MFLTNILRVRIMFVKNNFAWEIEIPHIGERRIGNSDYGCKSPVTANQSDD